MQANEALLFVRSHPAREFDEDLKAAGIAKRTDQGKLDFHACREAFVSWVVEAGASVKEAQSLARHTSPELTRIEPLSVLHCTIRSEAARPGTGRGAAPSCG